MKFFVLFIGLFFILSHSVFGNDFLKKWEELRIQEGYYDGDINQNEILEKTENYIVIRNLTAKAEINIPLMADMREYAEVFELEAKKHCKKNKYFNLSFFPFSASLDNHTVYIYCTVELDNILGANTGGAQICLNKEFLEDLARSENKEYNEIYEILDCEKVIQNVLKKYPKAKKDFYKIKYHNKKYSSEDFILKIKKRVLKN